MNLNDLKDSNYNFSSSKIGAMNMPFHHKRDYSLLWGIKRYVGKFFRSLKTFKGLNLMLRKEENTGYIIINSPNQYYAIEPLLLKSNINLFPIGVEWSNSQITQYPLFLAYLISILFIPVVLFHYFFENDFYFRKSVKYAFNEYCLTYGYRFVNNIWFAFNKPLFIIITNDHQFASRDIVKSAKKNDIPTVYIQHASVTNKFPKLITDFAFLEGVDSKEKYLNVGETDSTIKLVGILKLDEIIEQNDQHNIDAINAIGICTNQFDSLERTEELINILSKENKYEIHLRPHPGDTEYQEWKKLAGKHNINFSKSKTEYVLNFLNNIDVTISYNCNILLESILSNKPAISYQLSDKIFDHYGFVENNLVDHFSEPEKLINHLKQITPNSNWKYRGKRYCSTIGTEYEGKTIILIEQLLNEISYN